MKAVPLKASSRSENDMRLGDLISFEGAGFPIYPPLIGCLGLEAAVFLCRIIWYQPDPESWIEKNVAELQAQTGLQPARQRRARQLLEKAGIIEQKHLRLEHRLRFRVVAAALERELDTFAKRQNELPPNAKTDVGETPNSTSAKRPNGFSSIGKDGTKRQKIKEQRGQAAPAVDFPESLKGDEFKAAWALWEQYKKEKREKLTPSTIAHQLRKLAKFPASTAIEMINRSIENGWRGLFELTGPIRGQRPPPRAGEGKLPGGDEYVKRLKIIGGDE